MEGLINFQLYFLARELPIGVRRKQTLLLSKEILVSEVSIVFNTHGSDIKSSCEMYDVLLNLLFLGKYIYAEKSLTCIDEKREETFGCFHKF